MRDQVFRVLVARFSCDFGRTSECGVRVLSVSIDWPSLTGDVPVSVRGPLLTGWALRPGKRIEKEEIGSQEKKMSDQEYE